MPLVIDSTDDMREAAERIASRSSPDAVIACGGGPLPMALGHALKEMTGCPLVLDRVGAASDNGPGHAKGESGDHARNGAPRGADVVISSCAESQLGHGWLRVPDASCEDGRHVGVHADRRWPLVAACGSIVLLGTPHDIDELASSVSLLMSGAVTKVVVVAMTGPPCSGSIPGRDQISFCTMDDAGAEINASSIIYLSDSPELAAIWRTVREEVLDAVTRGAWLLAAPTKDHGQCIQRGTATPIRLDVLSEMLSQRGLDPGASADSCASAVETDSYPAAARALEAAIWTARVRAPHRWLATLGPGGDRRGRPCGRRGAEASDGVDIVIFWKQNDTGIYGRRVDMVAEYLASRSDVRRVLILDEPVGFDALEASAQLASGRNHNAHIYTGTYRKRMGLEDQGKVFRDVFVFRESVYSARGGARGRSLEGDYLEFLERAFDRAELDISQACFWFYPITYCASSTIDRFRPSFVVADVVDDHRAWPGLGPLVVKSLTKQYREVLGRSDVVLTNCSSVQESMSSLEPGARMIPNGCDNRMPRRRPESGTYGAVASSARRKIGYVGNLESKLDVRLISRLAREKPDDQILLIGSTHTGAEILDQLDLPNVLFVGVVPYQEIRSWIDLFDVAIIPHEFNQLTRSMNPLKLYVYASCAVPVVATSVPNIDSSPSWVHVAESHDQFIAKVDQVLEAGRPPEGDFHEFVEKNCWSTRLRETVDEVVLGARRASGRALA
ncbi:glycosyltransferase [Lolliginicoccus levis]|uniref:glycosyltransferase n=1 Tax=Lolliginicoccus levis TaxID=2919542 RepID=UPI00241F5CE0|nr:glycosyltransferase [Lolliginicoccus levis]